MKKILLQTAAFLLIGAFVISSCKKEEEKTEDGVPEITNIEALNHDTENDTVARGGTIGVNFDAKTKSSAKLDYYHLEIHDHPASGKVEDEYKIIDSTFKNQSTFKSLMNAHVHRHISVPDSANLGRYHVVIVVVDENGNSTDTEALETHIVVTEK